MTKSHLWLILSVLACLGGLPLTTGCASSLQQFDETRDMMDTSVTVTVYAPDEIQAKQAMDAAFSRIAEIEKIVSRFDEASELSRLNHKGTIESPSPELKELITLSLEYNKTTGGAFDITVLPLLNLWTNGLSQEPPEIQQARVDETMKLIGSDKVIVEENRIFFTVTGMMIALDGIAQGYAADEAVKVLAAIGVKNAAVNVGEDIAVLGTKPNGNPWLISLVNPEDSDESLANFKIINKGLATSGNYERYFDPTKATSLIIDPKTGYPAQKAISATIIAANATQANALATAAFVLGPEDGVKMVEQIKGVECLIVDADRTTINLSPGISKYLPDSK
jgi:thiamine biosynthesis lipoprotein